MADTQADLSLRLAHIMSEDTFTDVAALVQEYILEIRANFKGNLCISGKI